MRRLSVVLLLFALAAGVAPAQDTGATSRQPSVGGLTVMTTESGGTWYLKHEGRFSVLSDTREHALSLSSNLRHAQKWICTRWQLPERDLSMECRVYAVQTLAVLAKEFRIESPRVEMRKDESGKDVYAAFVVSSDRPNDTVMFFLTTILLRDMERQYNVRFGHWLYRGMGTLNCSYPRIREKVSVSQGRLASDQPIYFTQSLLNMSESDWERQPADLRLLYDGEAAVLCLTLLREFGRAKFVEFMGTGPSEQNLSRVFGVRSYDALDPQFKKHLRRLSVAQDNKSFQVP